MKVITDYSALFRHNIDQGLERILTEVQTVHPPIEDDWVSIRLMARARSIIDFSLAMPNLHHPTCKLLVVLAEPIEQGGHSSDWIEIFRVASNLALQFDVSYQFAELHRWTAVISRSLGRYDEARHWLQISIVQTTAIGDRLARAKALNALAWTERLNGSTDSALASVEQVLQELDEEKDEELLEIARGNSILGAIASDKGDWTSAESYCRKALQNPILRRDRIRFAWGYADLAVALAAQQKYEDALENNRLALEIIGDVEPVVQLATIWMNLSAIHLYMEQPEDALPLCLQSRDVFRNVSDYRRLIMAEINAGIAYRQMSSLGKAWEMLDVAIHRADRCGYATLKVNAMNELGQVQLRREEVQGAVAIFEQAIQCLEEIQSSKIRELYEKALQLQLRSAIELLHNRKLQ